VSLWAINDPNQAMRLDKTAIISLKS
jgi:hypothetical protein